MTRLSVTMPETTPKLHIEASGPDDKHPVRVPYCTTSSQTVLRRRSLLWRLARGYRRSQQEALPR
ncbi:hypothetical protein KCP77_14055 [Salmonella enterica subsp. enterica]|nr:hypothetical protein KCP77_14055 [Salmonella enterica subsp. enterica]